MISFHGHSCKGVAELYDSRRKQNTVFFNFEIPSPTRSRLILERRGTKRPESASTTIKLDV